MAAYNEAMDYTPRAETIRLWATASYLPLVAFGLLANRRYRDLRLIRFHAYQAIGLMIGLIMTLLFGSICSTLFGSLPGVGFLINLGVGLLYMAALIGFSAIGLYGAVKAYQGNYTSIPLLSEWVWIQVNGSGRAQPPRKRRKRRKLNEDVWTEEAEAEEEPF